MRDGWCVGNMAWRYLQQSSSYEKRCRLCACRDFRLPPDSMLTQAFPFSHKQLLLALVAMPVQKWICRVP